MADVRVQPVGLSLSFLYRISRNLIYFIAIFKISIDWQCVFQNNNIMAGFAEMLLIKVLKNMQDSNGFAKRTTTDV